MMMNINNNKSSDNDLIRMINHRDLDGAIVEIDKVLRNSPNDLNYLHYLGMVLYLKGNTSLADKTYGRAYSIATDKKIILKLQLEILTKIGEYKKALKIISKYDAELDLSNIDFLHQYALIYNGLNDFDNAKHFFVKAIRKNKEKSFLLYHYGFFLNSIGKHSLAVKSYLRGLKIFDHDIPQKMSILYNLSSSYSALSNNTKSLFYIDKLLELDCNNIEAKKKKALILGQMQKYEESIQIIKTILDKNENDLDCFVLLSRYYFLVTDYLRSIEFAEKAILINEDNIDARINLVSSLINLKKYTKAEEECLEGLRKEKNNINLLMNLSTLYTEVGEFEKALIELEKIKKLNSSNSTLISLYPYICEQLKLENNLDYFSEPIDFVQKYNLIEDAVLDRKLLGVVTRNCEEMFKRWEPKERTTKNGFQTDSVIFEANDKHILAIREIIYSYIKKYLLSFKDKKDLFIKNFPKSNKIEGWCVFLKESGHQTSHNHPSGWLSGCLYLNIPEKLKDDQGSIEFSYHGYNFPIINSKISKLKIKPKIGDLVLFPSSLFHKTIPFSEESERISIAFDIYPTLEN